MILIIDKVNTVINKQNQLIAHHYCVCACAHMCMFMQVFVIIGKNDQVGGPETSFNLG